MNFRFAVAALVALVMSSGAALAQGAGQLPSILGTDQVQINRPGSAYNNFATAAQMSQFINGGDSTPRNLLLGGDYTVNPFQRGTSNGSSHISNTLTYGPDGWWFLGGASSSIDWSQQTGASDITTGFGASLRFQRTAANTDTAAICRGQVLRNETSLRMQGQTAVYSVYALAGANFSAASSNVTVTVAYGTGANQSAASFASGSWTGYTSITLTPLQGSVAPAAGITQSVSTAWTRYAFSGALPATATQVGVKVCWTPVGTAGSNDWVEFAGDQLEVAPGAVASPFDFHLAATELNVSQRSLFVINEPAAGIGIGMGLSDSTTTCLVTIAFPDTMVAAPTVTFGGTALSGSTWQVRKTGANVALSTPFLAANTGHSLTNMNLTATTGASQVAGQACVLQGAGGGGKIIASAEL